MVEIKLGHFFFLKKKKNLRRKKEKKKCGLLNVMAHFKYKFK